ncbi:MAG: nitrilase-related carbon-nitrogen hydrolase, partial [Pseudomonadota bacterium]
MRLALYQANSPAGDISAGLKVVEQALADAAQVHADMLTMPEIFIPGYASTTATKPEGWDDVHARLSEMCAKHKVALTIGLAEYETDTVYNSAYTFDADGEVICKYRKIQLFGEDEKALYKPGNRYETFEYKGV